MKLLKFSEAVGPFGKSELILAKKTKVWPFDERISLVYIFKSQHGGITLK